jgi:hypothetical protein
LVVSLFCATPKLKSSWPQRVVADSVPSGIVAL